MTRANITESFRSAGSYRILPARDTKLYAMLKEGKADITKNQYKQLKTQTNDKHLN